MSDITGILDPMRVDPTSGPQRLRRLTDPELAQVASLGGAGLTGYGALTGALVSDEGPEGLARPKVYLITAGPGTPDEIRFTIDAATTRFDLLPGHRVRVFGLIHKTNQWIGTIRRAQIVHDSYDAQLLPGMHVELTGVIDNHEPTTRGDRDGEAMPTGSWLRLDQAVHIAGAVFRELHLEHSPLRDGDDLRIHGRLELRSVGGVRTPVRRLGALSGVSDVGAGEPRFDGVQFHSTVNGAHLRVLVLRRQELFDAPYTIVVLDLPQRRAFLGSIGGFQMPVRNPFHGFDASAQIQPANDQHREAVRFDDERNALDAATGQPLLFLDREAPPPDIVDGLTTAWYFDPARTIVYSFISGGVAGFMNRMATVITFSPDERDAASAS